MEEEFFSAEEPELGGHDFVFVDELSLGQICPICLVAMCNPVQTVCGHRFCESCLLGTFREGVGRVCPQDRTSIPEDGGYFRDVAWERDILSLRVKCKKSARGCDWTGMLRYYEDHVQLCEYEDVFCDDCNEELQRRSLNTHQTTECHNRIVQCEHCAIEFAFRLIESHEDECLRWPLDCPQECGVLGIPREQVESHVMDDCMMTLVPCPYEEAGCNFYDKRSNLNAHIDASCEEHLSKTWSKLLQTTERVNELEQVELHMQADIDSVKKSLEEAKGDVEQLKLSEAERKLENLQLKKDVLELQMKLKELHHNVISPRKNFVDVIEVTEVADNKEEVLKVVDPFSLHEETDCLLRLKKPKPSRYRRSSGRVPSPH
ncbi:TNF receptor-associated factor 4-like [Pocillopora verrucosa]|uniref:TNF receptor-associated factor 4-like n=1 Tax=Pocillopora verrucosa TaxID=203993 RepID=UPI00333FD588